MLVAALALALVAIGGALIVHPAVAQSEEAVSHRRHIIVVGHGEAEARPDTATVQIGVRTEAPTAHEALAQNNAQTKAIHEKIKEIGIDPNDIQTSTFSIFSTYDNEKPEITGYRVNNTISVTIRDLDQASTLLDQVVLAGANQINGISFRVSDPVALLEQARAKAVQDARAHAAQLAQAAGATLGEVLVITENVGSQPPQPAVVEAAGKGGDVLIEPGQQQIRVAVQMTYALE
jgi:uncharacterized protein YggE